MCVCVCKRNIKTKKTYKHNKTLSTQKKLSATEKIFLAIACEKGHILT